MDLLDFDAEAMYFDDPPPPAVEALIAEASERYSDGPDDPRAELCLLRAYFLAPEHLSVLVALYRFFYYRHAYGDALIVADRAIALSAGRLGVAARWQDLSEQDLGQAAQVSMTLTRFLLMALKGAGYLHLRLGEPLAALARFEKVAVLDSGDRLKVKDLADLARSAIAEAQAERAGPNVSFLRR